MRREVWTEEDNTDLVYSWSSRLDNHILLSSSLNSYTRPDSLRDCWRVQQFKLFPSCSSVQVLIPIGECLSLLIHFSSVKRRGGFLSLYALNLSLGILTTYCIGAIFYWMIVSIIPPFINFILFLALWRIPESPLWLLSHRGREDCREALQWLRC